MKRILIYIIALIFFSCPSAFAQDKVYKNLQPGDLVEAGVDWNPGVIVEGYKDTEWGYGEYRVHIEGKNGAPGYDERINARFVRPRRANAATNRNPEIYNGNTAQSSPNKEMAGTGVMFSDMGGVWESGAKIDSYDEQKRVYAILSKYNGNYVVPCHGVVKEGEPFNNDFYIGKWNVFINGAITTVARDGELYRRYSGGMKLPPLEINPDHTYIWRISPSKVIRGKWTDRQGAPGIVLSNGIDGGNWTLYEKTEGFATNAKTRDEIGFHDFGSGAGYYIAYRIGANQSCVLKGRKF